MASQRLFIATLVGEAAVVTAQLFAKWRADPSVVVAARVDEYCDALRANSCELQVVYFSEWIDRWLMGDLVPGPGAIEGIRFQASCFSRDEALDWEGGLQRQHQEQEWLASRLREAATVWDGLVDSFQIVVVREVFGGSASNEQIIAALPLPPAWLAASSRC